MTLSFFFSKNYFCFNNLFFSNKCLSLKDSLFYNEYAIILIFTFIAVLLSFIIIIFSYMFVVQNPETEKLSSYECGFEPYEDARHTFDVKFYLVAILFIVFDIETMFLIPWTNVLAQLDIVGFWSMIDFMFELGIGYLYIYYVGALNIN